MAYTTARQRSAHNSGYLYPESLYCARRLRIFLSYIQSVSTALKTAPFMVIGSHLPSHLTDKSHCKLFLMGEQELSQIPPQTPLHISLAQFGFTCPFMIQSLAGIVFSQSDTLSPQCNNSAALLRRKADEHKVGNM